MYGHLYMESVLMLLEVLHLEGEHHKGGNLTPHGPYMKSVQLLGYMPHLEGEHHNEGWDLISDGPRVRKVVPVRLEIIQPR